jgi:hypothetical protein
MNTRDPWATLERSDDREEDRRVLETGDMEQGAVVGGDRPEA